MFPLELSITILPLFTAIRSNKDDRGPNCKQQHEGHRNQNEYQFSFAGFHSFPIPDGGMVQPRRPLFSASYADQYNHSRMQNSTAGESN